jgi:hypothetical protein
MAKITIEVQDELSEQIIQLGDRLPELLALSLEQPIIPAHIYRYIIDFLVSEPTPEQIINFRPTLEMQKRLQALISRSNAETITPTEEKELDEYEKIEHLIIMLKSGSLPYLKQES